jgi:ATP-dependent phosphofructokinase / diphosphate-dependent phosphofructokinase
MKIGVLTGGGDTQTLNATLNGIIKRAKKYNHEIIGFRRGWQGVLDSDYISLKDVNPKIGGTILKTSRKKLVGTEINIAANNISKVVDAFIGIGGDDTLSVGKKISKILNIPVCFVTKTIDNDVGTNMSNEKNDFSDMINYFTPGFPSSANLVVKFAKELRTTAYSHNRIIFLEAMGRSPGWLALASYKANPDFILIPEYGLNYKQFLKKLTKRYKERKNAIIVVAEGLKYKGRKDPISEDKSNIDGFGHAKLGGVAEVLAKRVSNDLNTKECKSVNPAYLYRSGSPIDSEIKYTELLGKAVVDCVHNKQSLRVAVLMREDEKIYATTVKIDDVLVTDKNGSIIPRTVNPRFYDSENYTITPLGKEYFRLVK